MFLDLPLARAVLDASTPERAHPELIAELLADPGTRTLHMDAEGGIAVDDEGLVIGTIDGPREPGQIAVFLGRPLRGSLLEGDAYVLLIDEPIEGLAYRNTRATALALTEPERGLAVAASAIANWHRFYTHCGGCGTETNVVNSGWVRLCPACSTEHYPRTDPAVIMTIHDANDRVLLAHASHFPQKRYSLLAGYIEPGGVAGERRCARDLRGGAAARHAGRVPRLAGLAIPALTHAGLRCLGGGNPRAHR